MLQVGQAIPVDILKYNEKKKEFLLRVPSRYCTIVFFVLVVQLTVASPFNKHFGLFLMFTTTHFFQIICTGNLTFGRYNKLHSNVYHLCFSGFVKLQTALAVFGEYSGECCAFRIHQVSDIKLLFYMEYGVQFSTNNGEFLELAHCSVH